MFWKRVFSLPTLTLLTALTLSSIAAWYSILGLTAIFAAAVIPIIVMGGALEISKVVTTVWIHRYWSRCSLPMKMYLVPAVAVLALITSMGIFGFLSKAHLDQTLPTGDVAAQVALLDERIKVEKDNLQAQRDNIASARDALSQMNNQVNARLDRGTSEQGAERAVTIRKQQKAERAALSKEIQDSQDEIEKINLRIAKLNEERIPIASKLRKVEAEVGPVKYIAALIYGDQLDQNLLERAVRWVIILLVIVFDPLALCLVIASISSRKWEDDDLENEKNTPIEISHVPVPKDDVKVENKETIKEKIEPIKEIESIEPIQEPESTTVTTPIENTVEEDGLKKRLLGWEKSPLLNLIKKLKHRE